MLVPPQSSDYQSKGQANLSGFNAGGQVKAISLSPNKKHLMVGGRDVLKILEIQDDMKMELLRNYHTRKKNNLNFGAMDIRWNQEHAQYVISSSPNNSINVWDIEHQNKKPVKVYTEHNRQNRLCWDPFNPQQFLSGSNDTTIKLWDINMDRSVFTMQRMKTNDDQVYCVSFNPMRQNQFAACYGNGGVEIWDLRQPRCPVYTITATYKNALYVDWHHSVEDVLITGSNDKFIKVWNIKDVNSNASPHHTIMQQNASMQPLFQIQTPQAVKKCQWVPGQNFQISSCSINAADSTVNIWHCKKPFLQQYVIKNHKDAVTDFEWLHPNENLITSVEQMVIIQNIRTAIRPYEKICTSCHDFSIYEDLAIVNDKIKSRDPDQFLEALEKESSIADVFFKNPFSKKTTKSDMSQTEQDQPTHGILQVFNYDQEGNQGLSETSSSTAQIEQLASSYKFRDDKPIAMEELCIHNAGVALDINLEEVAQSWYSLAEVAKELKMINQYTSAQSSTIKQVSSQPINSNQTKIGADGTGSQTLINNNEMTQLKAKNNDTRGNAANKSSFSNLSLQGFAQQKDLKCDTYFSRSKSKNKNKKNNQIQNHYQTQISDEQDSIRLTQQNQIKGGTKVFENNFLEIQMYEPSEQDEEDEEEKSTCQDNQPKAETDANLPVKENLKSQKLPTQPHQASQMTNTMSKMSGISGGALQEQELTFDVVFGQPPKRYINTKDLNGSSKKKHYLKSVSAYHPNPGARKQPQMQKWIQEIVQQTVIDTIMYYTDNGDLQTGAIMALVFYEQLNFQQYQSFLSRIICSYIELLRKLQIYPQVTEIIKYGPKLKEIDQLYGSGQSPDVSLLCQFCKTQEESVKRHICTNPKCGKVQSRCSICHLAVKSLYLWCQGCSHGGHHNHMLKWFNYNKFCPSGCGHQCKE